jgi:hypothetical protein
LLFMTFVIGWPALVILILTTIGYAILLGGVNDRFYPNGKTPRRRRRRRRR